MAEREISRLIRKEQARINGLYLVTRVINASIKQDKLALKLKKRELKQRKKELKKLMKMGL